MYSVCLVDYNGTPASDTPTVVSNELYIYDPVTNDEGLVVIDPMLSLEVSKAGSFSCSLPQTNYGFGRIIDKVTRLVVRKNNKIIFIGRINSEDRDLYLTQKIIAEGALAYLNDSLTEKKTIVASNDAQNPATTLFKLLDYIFTNHNTKFQYEPWKKFHLSQANCHADFVGYNSKDVNSNELTQLNLNFDTSLSIVESLLDTANAMLNIEWDDTNNYWEVYIYNKFDTGVNSSIPRTTQPIEFGLNLLDLTQSYDSTDIVTAVAPFGGDLIQESKEIGVIVASNDITTYVEEAVRVDENGDPILDEHGHEIKDIYNHCLWRYGEDPDYNYAIYFAGEYYDSGYWAFAFNIGAYNNDHPDAPLKKLYLSWRAYKFTTANNYIADNSWRIYQRIWNIQESRWDYQTLGFHELTANNEGFESEINEEIDLTSPQYKMANWIRIGGWGGLITPIIRRDAIVVEEADKLNISKCDAFNTDSDGLRHPADSYYLYSDTLINTYGLIEKKLEFDIEDANEPKIITDYEHDGFSKYEGAVLGYPIVYDQEQNPDYETNKGLYTIIQNYDSAYTVLEYGIPGLTNPARPKGIFVTSQMHDLGDVDGKKVNGMYALYDTSNQLLNYKAAASSEKGFGFTSIEREFIDLNDPKNYGAAKIRVGGYTGGGFSVELLPSDDTKPRNRLMEQAKLYLTSYQWDKIVIEAQAIDLSLTSNEWEALDICKLTEVNSSFHGATFWKPITSLELNLNNFEDNSIKLGYDNDEYMSYQLNESLRLSAIERTIEERRNTT